MGYAAHMSGAFRRLVPVFVSGIVTLAAACSTSPPPTSSPSAPTGIRLSYTVLPGGAGTVDPAALDKTRDVVQSRLNAAGYVSPVVTVDGSSRILVDLPLGTDTTGVTDLVTAPGVLAFVPLPPDTYGTATTGGPNGVFDNQPLPTDPALVPLFEGGHVTSANPGTDGITGEPVVMFTLDTEASELFTDYTRGHVGDFFAIVLDGMVVSVPSIAEPITNGSGQIAMGAADNDKVTAMNRLVTILRSGELPYPLSLETEVPSASP